MNEKETSPNPTFLLAAMAGLGEFAATAYLPAIPSIAEDFGVGVASVQATVTTGLLAFAVSNLMLGPVSDRIGRRAVLLPAFLVYLAGCILAAAAPTVAWLFPARALQAIGACAGLVIGRAIARDLYEGAALTRLMATVTLVFSIAPALAPLIGGLLTDGLGWRSIFGMAFLYAALLLPAVWRLPETLETPQDRSPVTVLFTDYLRMAQQRNAAPHLFGSAFLIGALFGFLIGASPIFVTGLGLSPSMVGCFPLLTMTGFVLGAISARRLAGRLRESDLERLGSAIALGGALTMSIVPTTAVGILFALALFNVGLGLALPAASAAVMSSFPGRAGQASSLIGFVQISGGALGAGLISAWGEAPEQTVPLAMVAMTMGANLVFHVWRIRNHSEMVA